MCQLALAKTTLRKGRRQWKGSGVRNCAGTCPSKCWSLRLPFLSDFGTGKHVDSGNGFMSGAGILSQSHHENESFQRLDILDADLGVHRWESCHFGNANSATPGWEAIRLSTAR